MIVLNASVHLHEFFEKVRKGSLLILDYDGTLAPFVTERIQAYPYPGVNERLETLIMQKKTRLVIVSGRALEDLERLLTIAPKIELWGSHGLERKLFNGKIIRSTLNAKMVEGLEKGKKICLENTDPSHCEIKPYGVSFHWRGIQESEKISTISRIKPLWESLSLIYELEMHHFDGGFELRPKGRNKGNVIQKLLREIPQGTALAYLGDDATDEEAFAALGDRGLKVLVRQQLRPTLADIYLVPPQELLAFLDQWIRFNQPYTQVKNE